MKKLSILLVLLLLCSSCAPNLDELDNPVSASVEVSAQPSKTPVPSYIPPTPSLSHSPSESPTADVSPVPSFEPVTIQMAGDILLHSKLNKSSAISTNTYDYKPYFEKIKPYINGDLSICNMEVPIDVNGENKDISTYPMFNAPYEILEAVKDAGFDLLVNANNHSFDKGWKGLAATKANFKKAEIQAVGTYETQQEFDTYTIIDVNGMKIGVISYTDALNGMESAVPSENLGFAIRRFSSENTNDVPKMIEDMENCRKAGAEFIILSLHWGAEYVNEPNSTQKEIARLLCEGGADILMGNHSHCVQPIVWQNGKDGGKSLCIYSLGNFFADQNDMENPISKTQYSMIVNTHLERDQSGKINIVSSDFIPTFTLRYSQSSSPTGVSYMIMPSKDFLQDQTVFSSAKDFERNGQAYEHVLKIAGTATSVFSN